MKRILIIILLICALTETATAQRITRNFQNVSMSDALKYIQQQTGNHKIVFIYNELEDFTITTNVKNKPVPDAIRQIIGFYPIQMIMGDNNDIYVECIHKTEHHLKGLVVDENNLPLPYANVTLLNPSDSTMVGGGVTNESGRFVIPNDHGKVIARISYVGYKPTYLVCSRDNVGTIKMQLDNFTLDGVTVKGSKRLTRPTNRGLLANVQGTVLEQFGSVTEMLSHLPLMLGDGTIAGHGKPEIYINNKKVRDASELDRYRADEILSAEIITNPGPEYGQDVKSVIRLKTIKKQGDGLSGNVSAEYNQKNVAYERFNLSLNYRLKNGMDFFSRGQLMDWNQLSSAGVIETMSSSSIWDYNSHSKNRQNSVYLNGDFGWNWQINDCHSIGVTYYTYSYVGNGMSEEEGEKEVYKDGELVDVIQTYSKSLSKPRISRTVNAYYLGQIGKWTLDFSADYYRNRSEQEINTTTNGENSASSITQTKNQFFAEKLTITAPVPKGELTFGEEVTNVNRYSDFIQSGYAEDNHIHQLTTTWSLYADYGLSLNKFSLNTGVRWQNEINRYYLDSKRDEEMSPNFHVVIPYLSAKYLKDDWSLGMAYRCYRLNPAYSMLSSAVEYNNKYSYSAGNPFLQPQVHHDLSLEAMWKWMYADFTFGHVDNTYTRFFTPFNEATHPGVILSKYTTMPSGYYYYLRLNASPKIGIWQMNYSATISYTDRDLAPMGIAQTFHGIEADFTFDNTLTLPYSWLLNIQVNYSPYYESGFTQRKASCTMNMRIGRRFLKDKSLNVAVRGSDIFRTYRKKYVYYNGLSYRRDYNFTSHIQGISIDVSWSFNATRSRYKGSHAGQAERNRL